MSENEKLKRQQYKEKRKKWIIIQAIALALAIVLAVGLYATFDRMNQTYYIEYSEGGYVDYRVYLDENDFFEEDYVGKDHNYIASLINTIVADFNYTLNMDSAGMSFDYTYRIDAKTVVADKTTGYPIISPAYELVPETKGSVNGKNKLTITPSIQLDFDAYNDFATEFEKIYNLTNAKATLIVTMTVNVLSSCDEFDSNQNAYSISLNIPLAEENFSIYSSASTPSEETKVLACSGGVNQNLFRVASIIFAVLAVALAVTLFVFVSVTKNEDINYTNKVRKLVSSYRSFIQQMDGAFDMGGYQVVPIKTFVEMLGIRDTIQSPILMFENADQTKTEFIITTNTKILYLFEIRVDNYDELYGTAKEAEAVTV